MSISKITVSGKEVGPQISQLVKRQWIDLVLLLVHRDLRVRYRGSILGYVWSMLNPLLYMIILTLVFSHVVRVKSDTYALFILSGIMVWNLFQQSISMGIGSIIGSGHLLKKVKIPGFLFPTASVCGVLINFALSFIPFLVISLVLHAPLSPVLVFLPVVIVPFVIFIWGLVVLLACLNVRYRDIGHAMEPFMQMLFYATPVVYPLEIIPEKWRFLIKLNPIARFIDAFRGLMLRGEVPHLRDLAILLGVAVVTCVGGAIVYRKSHEFFVYNL